MIERNDRVRQCGQYGFDQRVTGTGRARLVPRQKRRRRL
jgi:hypothetical protein